MCWRLVLGTCVEKRREERKKNLTVTLVLDPHRKGG
jgi:hypothetical protein